MLAIASVFALDNPKKNEENLSSANIYDFYCCSRREKVCLVNVNILREIRNLM
jgi:hypothetical protein